MSTMHSIKLVLQCDNDGRVLCADGDGSALLPERAEPRLLALLVDAASAAKCERFLQKVRAGAAFGWELHLSRDGQCHALLFAGLRSSAQRLSIVASDSHEGLVSALDASCVTPDSASPRPDAAAAASSLQRAPALIDELTRVNNDLVSLQRELAKRNAELFAVTKQRNELLAIAAHDLRSPVLVVQGYCDLLGLASADESGPQRQLVQRVQEASELMLHVIEETLEFAQLEAGKARARPSAIDLAALVRRCGDSYRASAERKQIELIVSCVEDLPKLVLEPTQMTQVIGNLLSNAIKFSDRGGLVELTLERTSADVVLTVRDRGQGIAAAELPLLFLPFQTTTSRPTAGEPSTGLGLAIVHKLVQANGGRITVRSAPNQGSTFALHFPLPPPREKETRHTREPRRELLRGRDRSRN